VRITYYRQNAFKIESADKRILIDPGRSLSSFRSLIPKREWRGIDIVFVTHRDPDHFGFVPAIAAQCGCHVVCSPVLQSLMERRGIEKVHLLSPGDRIDLEGFEILGLPAVHGPGKAVEFPERERNTKGCVGFSFRIEGKRVVNLGDSVFVEAWKGIEAEVLMVPIGGFFTMNRREAARVTRLIRPEIAIPTHYHWKFGPYVHPARVSKFAEEISTEGVKCTILGRGESIEVETRT
jgi:L-ascorbate metabolism protein UlaG (beta-lactamase superfamily)